jgi:hypothetical protein
LLPLFEAVVNSIHAIDALGIDDGVVRIQLIRSAAAPLPFEPGSAGGGLPDVEGFEFRTTVKDSTPATARPLRPWTRTTKFIWAAEGSGVCYG